MRSDNEQIDAKTNGNKNTRDLFSDTRGDKLDENNNGNMFRDDSSSECMIDAINGNRKEDCENQFSEKRVSFEKEDSVFYLDKNVTACDLSEIVVCYNENTYQIVKDICIDEGLSVHEKILSEKNDSFKSLDINPTDLCNDSELEVEDKTSDEQESSRKCNNHENMIVTELVKDDANRIIVKEMSKKSLTLVDIMSMEDDNKKRPFNESTVGSEEPFSQEVAVKATSTSESEALAPKINENDHSSVSTSQESSKPSNSTSGFGFGETSFSAAESVSGHIMYSGPIVYSGSLSVRSDGSTTSTRSFAFPVLQSEWNSSPVRMVKADKRHHPRQKCWRDTFCCFRF